MYHINEIFYNTTTLNILLTVPPKITFTIYEALSVISSGGVPRLFYCVDQCENIYEQLMKLKFLEPIRNLTKDQVLAVLLYIYECSTDYKESLCYLLNKALVMSDSSFDLYLTLLRSAFHNLVVTKRTVYKAILPEEQSIYIDPIRRAAEKGVKFRWLAYSRCTLSLDQAKTWATTTGTILEIENAQVLSLGENFGNIISNCELVLSPNAVYGVTAKDIRIPIGFWGIKLQAEQDLPF